jgi:voltage-gated potassium channel
MIDFFLDTQIRIHLVRLGIVVAILTLVGTLGYIGLENWSVVDALYMTVITLSTVGFGEVQPLSTAGKVFTTGLIVSGVAMVAYLAGAIGQHIVSGALTGTLRRKRMQRSVDALTNHYIICGFGRVGSEVARDLTLRGRPCVVVEMEANELARRSHDHLHIIGDAVEDDTLRQAGIARALGLVAATGDDATNLFITLSACTLNRNLVIVARANQPASETKLRQAGATHVISPYTISGQRIAAQLLTPSITDFLDVVMHSGDLELWLEECHVQSGSDLHNRTVAEADVRNRSGANVLAVRRGEQGTTLTDLPVDARFIPGDTLIALGTKQQLEALHDLAAS